MKQCGVTLWLTGLSGAGKTTITQQVEVILRERGVAVERLDGDVVRQYLTKDLGFSRQDRLTNVERSAFVADLLCKHDIIVLAAFISPYREMRDRARAIIRSFREVYVSCPLETCVDRDVKGLYKKALNGEISQFTGISDPYEPPLNPDLALQTDRETAVESALNVVRYLEENGFIPREDA
ncbi:adenylyl-sulfate kinase [Numidum massiliense]|uniref:adenylyl-sulfate kinase n=1 Tax=Numidum massiliense TaxID=1522315 RepID=UPI0006D54A03|nr:adenylyl-sulfate kinase [Numidum massiliense]